MTKEQQAGISRFIADIFLFSLESTGKYSIINKYKFSLYGDFLPFPYEVPYPEEFKKFQSFSNYISRKHITLEKMSIEEIRNALEEKYGPVGNMYYKLLSEDKDTDWKEYFEKKENHYI